ncbi:MAG: DUF99 family protein [Candidatus Thermoplasmatota archaeon]|jgi:hypothetical protein|nr:DUF99 family protein [Candidatus Thermoplasmatota archaeon]
MTRWPLKKEARVVGVDDGPYVRGSKLTVVVLTLYRLDGSVEGVLSGNIGTDGSDSAEVISGMMEDSAFSGQARLIVSDGACLAGFNVLDMDLLHERTGLPVLTISDERPDDASIKAALLNLSEAERRWGLIDAHRPVTLKLPDGDCYVRSVGVPEKEMDGLLRSMTVRGRTPEPIRLSHMFARCVHDHIGGHGA